MTSTTPIERPIDWPEVLFVASFIPLAVFSWVGLLLAEFGAFNGWRVAAAGGIVSAIALAAAWRDLRGAGPIQRVSRATWLSVGLLAALSTTLLARPGDYLIEGADASVYLAVGHNLGRTGGVITTDPVVSLMPQDLRPSFFRVARGIRQHEARLPGGLRLGDDDRVNPGFFHLLPVWIAIGVSAAGPSAGYFVNVIPAIFGVIAVFLIGRRLWSHRAGLVAAALLAVNFGQIYFGGLPASEMLTQFMGMSGILFTIMAWDLRLRVVGACAGAAIGLAAFTRVDALLVMVPLAVLWLLQARRSKSLGRAWSSYVTLLILVSGHAMVHAGTVAGLYTRRLFEDGLAMLEHNVIAAPPLLVVVGPIALCALALVILVFRRRRVVWLGLGATVTAIGVIALSPPIIPMVGRLISPVGAAAALGGLTLLTWRSHMRTLPLVAPLIAQSALLLALHEETTLPDDFRRAVPLVLPGAMLCVGFLVSHIGTGRTWTARAIWILPIGLGVAFLNDAAPILRTPPLQGAHAQIADLAARIPPDALVISDTSVPGHLSLALTYTFDRRAVRVIARPTSGTGIDPLISAALTSGRQVYVVAAPMVEHKPLWLWRSDFADFDIRQEHELSLRYAVLVRTRGVFPRELRTDSPPVAVYQVRARDWQTRAPLPHTVEVGVDDFQALVDGFHAAEPFHSTRARWTTGDSRIALPRVASPASGRMDLVLRFAADRPSGHAPVEVRLAIGGIPVGTITAPTIELREYRVALSAAAIARLLAGPSILSMASDVFVPKDLVGGTDDRRLGVMLDWVRVE